MTTHEERYPAPELVRVYLFLQTFKDGRVMIGRWSPDCDRRFIPGGVWQEKTDGAKLYLACHGWPKEGMVLESPFEVIVKVTK